MDITPQGIDVLHVRDDALDIGRGVIVSANGHVYVQPDGSLGFTRAGERTNYHNPYTSRAWDGRKFPDVSPGMLERVKARMLEAARAYIDANPDALEGAQRADSAKAAADYRETAAKLRALADTLDGNANALDLGGRVVYREHGLAGRRSTVRHVLTAAGELLPSLPTVNVYGTDDHGPRLPEGH